MIVSVGGEVGRGVDGQCPSDLKLPVTNDPFGAEPA
jgi:hypothetical protein